MTVTVFICCTHSILTADTWHFKDADYRLEVKKEQTAANGFIELNKYALPCDLENGVNVVNNFGKEIPYNLYKNGGLIIGKNFTTGYVYFGFQHPNPNQRWLQSDGELPAENLLNLKIFHARWQYITPSQWLERQRENATRQTQRQSAWILDYIQLQFACDLFARYRYPWRLPPKMFIRQSYYSNDWYRAYDADEYMAWRYKWSYPRNAANIENLWRKSIANINIYEPIRLEWGIKRLQRILLQQEKNIEKVAATASTGPERDFVTMFERGRAREGDVPFFDKTRIEKGMVEIRNNYAAAFAGNLVIRQSGEYEFAVNVSGGALLLLDDKIIINCYGENERNSSWQRHTTVKLTGGLHKFKFYYQKNMLPSYAVAAWKKKGETEFQPINIANFCPGWPLKLVQCQEQSGRKYPIIEQTAGYLLYTGKRDKMWWNNYKVIIGGPADWSFNEKRIANSEAISIIFPFTEKSEIKVSPVDNHLTPMRFIPKHNSNGCKYGRPDIMIKLWMPDFIFDDEYLETAVEVVSKMQWDVTCYLNIVPERDNEVFGSSKKAVVLQGRNKDDDDDRFIPDSYYKEKIMVSGAAVKNLKVNFSLDLPGINFDNQSVKFIPVNEISNLKVVDGKLKDNDNNQIVPVLHRPSLAELRNWQLPTMIYNKLNGITQMLVIADDYGSNDLTFCSTFRQRSSQHGVKALFWNWSKTTKSGERYLLNLAAVLPNIDNTSADSLLIVPPALELLDGLQARSISRLLATIIERARNNPKIKHIFITTAVPMLNLAIHENELNDEIKHLARDYDVRVLDLNSHVRKLPVVPSDYQNYDGSVAVLPVALIQAICDYITGSIVE